MTNDAPSNRGPILVVDDDDGARTLVALALKRAGFEVVDASSGQAALDLVATTPVSLVVLDMGMPGLSGTEVVEQLRARPETLTLPVLLMTGSGDEYRLAPDEPPQEARSGGAYLGAPPGGLEPGHVP